MRMPIPPDDLIALLLGAVAVILATSSLLFVGLTAVREPAGAPGCGRFIPFPFPEASSR